MNLLFPRDIPVFAEFILPFFSVVSENLSLPKVRNNLYLKMDLDTSPALGGNPDKFESVGNIRKINALFKTYNLHKDRNLIETFKFEKAVC